MFDSLIDQEQPIRFLTAILQGGAIPHALLFTGIEGIGKQTSAIAFAMASNCTDLIIDDKHKRSSASGPCGKCRSCKKILSGNHPDIILIKPSGSFIKVDQIRNLCSSLAMKPYEARLRVILIPDAQAMNPEASNALLKVLEEPPDRTLFILTALQLSDLLPTIVSRCQHIRFNPISPKNLEVFLAEKHGLDSHGAMIIAAMANGSISKALSMSRTNWIKRRNWLITEVESLSSGTTGSILAFAEMLSQKKEILSDSLEIINTWFRDLILFRYYPEKIINKDLIDQIQSISQKVTISSLLSKIKAVESAQKDILANTNSRLTIEVLIMRLAKV